MKSLLQKSFLFSIYAILYLPILILIIYSFNDSKFSLLWHGFSMRWYQELLQDRSLWEALINSLVLAFCAAATATVLSVLTSVHLFLFQSRHRQTIYALLMLLIIIPDLVLGVALLIFFNVSHIPLGFSSLLIAHISFCLPFAMIMVNVRINTLNPNVYFSALDLGASHFLALRRILLPLLWPSVLSAFLLCFTLSLDDVMISYFVAGPDFNILPLTIYSLVRAGVSPEINALCCFTLLLSMILVILSHRLAGKNA